MAPPRVTAKRKASQAGRPVLTLAGFACFRADFLRRRARKKSATDSTLVSKIVCARAPTARGFGWFVAHFHVYTYKKPKITRMLDTSCVVSLERAQRPPIFLLLHLTSIQCVVHSNNKKWGSFGQVSSYRLLQPLSLPSSLQVSRQKRDQGAGFDA